jgi:transposase
MDRSISGSHSLRETKFPAAKHAQMASLRLPLSCCRERGSDCLSVQVGRCRACARLRPRSSSGMKSPASWAPAPSLNVFSVSPGEAAWTVELVSRMPAACPDCGMVSGSRHSSYLRTIQDLPSQGTPVTIRARATRWRCRNAACGRRVFAERLPHLAARYGRRTTRLDEIVRLFGHSAGGRSSERLMSRLGMSVSDTTILRSIKEAARPKAGHVPVRVVGIDEWAWRKGLNYGTIIVDLEQRQVVGLLGDRSSSTSAAWFMEHPELEIINRDRAGLYADAARQGAPQARQIADRFHIVKNFRETIERQLGRYEAPIRKTEVPVEDIDTNETPLRESEAAGSRWQLRGRQSIPFLMRVKR